MSRHRFLIVLGITVLVIGSTALGLALSGSKSTVVPAKTTPTSPGGSSTSASTFLGPYGVEARWVIEENKRPGTTNWQIKNQPAHGMIEGFANLTYAEQGETVTLYVSTSAKFFRVNAYRMGYYQGKGARLVWRSKQIRGRMQPDCPVEAGVNMVSCDNWTMSLKMPITSAFVQGDYLLKLVGTGHVQSYVPLTIFDPTSHSAYLIKNDVFTWQAWNPFGGDDFYEGTSTCAPTYPPCSRARVVSFDRPYAVANGASEFLANEYPLVSFAEEHGLDVSYATDVTIEQHPNILMNHRVLLSLGHDECWSLTERDAAQKAQKAGLNIVFFAASAVLRHVRLQASPLGPDREEVDYRDSSEDPLNGKANPLLVTGNTWSSPPTSWPETGFVGESYAGYLFANDKPVPFVVAENSAWLFRGTGLHVGSRIPGVIASDFDQFEASAPHPDNVEIFGHSPIPISKSETSVSGPNVYSDMTYYTDPTSHAGVFDTGTNHWIPSLSPCYPTTACKPATIARITGNLLRLFGQGPAGKTEPSVANWQKIYP